MVLWAMVIGILALVVWQDFTHRAVYVWIFPLLAVLAIAHSIMLQVFSLAFILTNLIIVVIQLCVLNILLYGKRKKWLMHGEQWLGWGDVAFFAVLTCCFSTVNFILFYVVSLIIVLLATLLAIAVGCRMKNIPLAGGQAALLAMVLLADYVHWGRQLYIDIDVLHVIQ
ncbi:hypothetical protein [Parapedobacter koreensis]|uniref:Type IV leader peptidase family protein n=1 Tax=Parapedobacter koreensis TaxID=332977 RepID=A0A1H7HWX5_9SPHI|nr:hypothetical protein [Parapedobacter koreensis]SEK54749.1 hypothetical protein SAMN05421740_10244 [Parapedobacter koreensis]